MIQENWVPLPRLNNAYAVSNLGRIKRIAYFINNRGSQILLPELIRAVSKTKNGYLSISIFKKHYLVHRLIWEGFNGPCPPHLEINHKDGIKTNNCILNIEAVTRSQNQKHAIDAGLRKIAPNNGHWLKNFRKPGTGRRVKHEGVIYSGVSEAAKALGVNKGTIESHVGNKVKNPLFSYLPHSTIPTYNPNQP